MGDASVTDEDPSASDDEASRCLHGTLSKWTNYLHGWQWRYFELRDGSLSYYKSADETGFGCRGAVAIERACVTLHEADDCRFDIVVNDSVWYLRADTAVERRRWVDALETFTADSGFGSQTDLRRQGSSLSLTSTRSLASTSSFKRTHGLKEKLAELGTFYDIVCRQVDSLQLYFDAFLPAGKTRTPSDRSIDTELTVDDVLPCTGWSEASPPPKDSGSDSDSDGDGSSSAAATAADFRGQSLTFRATSAAILSTLQHCIDLMQQRDDMWRRRLDKEAERRRRVEEQYKQAAAEVRALRAQKAPAMVGGPDYEEGPLCVVNDEEWHDAVDAALEHEDAEYDRIQRNLFHHDAPVAIPLHKSFLSSGDRLHAEVDALTTKQLEYALAGVDEGVWQQFAGDGDMRMYKRDVIIDGMICDPLKAVHSVKGVTAREYLHFFFETDYKLDWDTTLETMRLVERVADDTLVIHQLHKRMWPASQRESLFWSHLRRADRLKTPDAHDLIIVCNHDLERADVPLTHKSCLRVGLTVSMVCQTVIGKHAANKQLCELSRNDITCKITYVSQVNPGGWAPSSILRMVYKKEYPKFLKRFTAYVLQNTAGKPVTF